MTDKPKLILHPGFPKAATSTLQWLFYQDNHRVSRELELTFIGKGLKFWSPAAPVAEFMYDEAQSIQNIANLQLDISQTYFLSSEALSRRTHVLNALASRFDITQIILTVRMPILMALSNFCFSGWLTHRPADIQLGRRHLDLNATAKSLTKYGPMQICPIEPSALGSRFCKQITGTAPTGVDQAVSKIGSVNSSVPPALAATLSHMLHNRLAEPVPGPLRAAFARVASTNKGTADLADELPPVFHKTFQSSWMRRREISNYGKTLRKGHVPDADRAEAIQRCQSRMDALAAKPVVSDITVPLLRKQAALILDKIQSVAPETRALFKPEFQIPLD